MTKDQVIQLLHDNRVPLRRRFVRTIALFGSVVRGCATETSDVDLLVDFEPGHPSGLFEFLALQAFLEDLLNCRVDLVTRDGLRPELRDQILAEAVRAA